MPSPSILEDWQRRERLREEPPTPAMWSDFFDIIMALRDLTYADPDMTSDVDMTSDPGFPDMKIYSHAPLRKAPFPQHRIFGSRSEEGRSVFPFGISISESKRADTPPMDYERVTLDFFKYSHRQTNSPLQSHFSIHRHRHPAQGDQFSHPESTVSSEQLIEMVDALEHLGERLKRKSGYPRLKRAIAHFRGEVVRREDNPELVPQLTNLIEFLSGRLRRALSTRGGSEASAVSGGAPSEAHRQKVERLQTELSGAQRAMAALIDEHKLERLKLTHQTSAASRQHDLRLAREELKLADIQGEHRLALGRKRLKIQDLNRAQSPEPPGPKAGMSDLETFQRQELKEKRLSISRLKKFHEEKIRAQRVEIIELELLMKERLRVKQRELIRLRQAAPVDHEAIEAKEAEISKSEGIQPVVLEAREKQLHQLRESQAKEILKRHAEMRELEKTHYRERREKQREIDAAKRSHDQKAKQEETQVLLLQRQIEQLQREQETLKDRFRYNKFNFRVRRFLKEFEVFERHAEDLLTHTSKILNEMDPRSWFQKVKRPDLSHERDKLREARQALEKSLRGFQSDLKSLREVLSKLPGQFDDSNKLLSAAREAAQQVDYMSDRLNRTPTDRLKALSTQLSEYLELYRQEMTHFRYQRISYLAYLLEMNKYVMLPLAVFGGVKLAQEGFDAHAHISPRMMAVHKLCYKTGVHVDYHIRKKFLPPHTKDGATYNYHDEDDLIVAGVWASMGTNRGVKGRYILYGDDVHLDDRCLPSGAFDYINPDLTDPESRFVTVKGHEQTARYNVTPFGRPGIGWTEDDRSDVFQVPNGFRDENGGAKYMTAVIRGCPIFSAELGRAKLIHTEGKALYQYGRGVYYNLHDLKGYNGVRVYPTIIEECGVFHTLRHDGDMPLDEFLAESKRVD